MCHSLDCYPIHAISLSLLELLLAHSIIHSLSRIAASRILGILGASVRLNIHSAQPFVFVGKRENLW